MNTFYWHLNNKERKLLIKNGMNLIHFIFIISNIEAIYKLEPYNI